MKHFSEVEEKLFTSSISYLWTDNLYGPVRNTFVKGKSTTRASARGLGPGNRDFFGPFEIASIDITGGGGGCSAENFS